MKRYIQSAEFECEIIKEIHDKDTLNDSRTVNMLEYFLFEEQRKEYMGIVFETLGKSLYEFIKDNNYRGIFIKIKFKRFFFENNPKYLLGGFARNIIFT